MREWQAHQGAMQMKAPWCTGLRDPRLRTGVGGASIRQLRHQMLLSPSVHVSLKIKNYQGWGELGASEWGRSMTDKNSVRRAGRHV